MFTTDSRVFQAVCLFVCLGFLLGPMACTTAKMACPPKLSSSAVEMPVSGRQGFGLSEVFSFGPYKVTDVHRGWRVTTAWGVLGYGSSKSEQPFEFKVQANAHVPWQAHCATGVRWTELEFKNFMDTGGDLEWGLSSNALFTGEFSRPGNEKPWKMVMRQETGDRVMDGLLSDGAIRISVKGTRKLAGGAWPLTEATGYLFYGDRGLVGAVDVLNQGTVYIIKDLPDPVGNALAAAASALLLYRDLRE